MDEAMPDRPLAREYVCAVVVTYHPGRDFPDRLCRILPQVAATFIIDNGSSDDEMNMLHRVAAQRAATGSGTSRSVPAVGSATVSVGCNCQNLCASATLHI